MRAHPDLDGVVVIAPSPKLQHVIRRRIVAAMLVLTTGGCVRDHPTAQPVQVQQLPVDHDSGAELGFEVQGETGAIRIRDQISFGNCHSSERMTAVRKGGSVVFRIEYPRLQGFCSLVGHLSAYEARIQGLKPGVYNLRVEYRGDVSSRTQSDSTILQRVQVH